MQRYHSQVWRMSPVGSVNNAFPLYSGRFSSTCPRTVLTRLHVYGSPSVTSFYLSQLWIFALHSAHTTKVFLCIWSILRSRSFLPFNFLRVRTWCITISPCLPHSSHVFVVSLSIKLNDGVLNIYGRLSLGAVSQFKFRKLI